MSLFWFLGFVGSFVSGYDSVGFGFGLYTFVIGFESVSVFFIFECLVVFVDVCLSLGCSWVCVFFRGSKRVEGTES